MAEKLRAAVLGATGRGNYGHAIDVAMTKVPRLQVVAVSDPDPAGLRAAMQRLQVSAGYRDYRELLRKERPDVVAICPRWLDQHFDMLMACAEAGCHVYMEKPFCRDLHECDVVVNELQMRHLKLAIAHVTQYSPVLTAVRRIIADGVIGELLELRGRGKEDHRGGGEDLWVLGSHMLMLMKSLVGHLPAECSARVMQDGRPMTAEDIHEGNEGIGLLAGDRVHAVYRFPGGTIGEFSSVRNMAARPSRFGLVIYGSKGVIEMESGYGLPAWLLPSGSWSAPRSATAWQKITSAGIGQPEPLSDLTYQGGHVAAVNDLLDAVKEQRQPVCSAEDARDVVEMTAAVFESQRLQQPVTLPLQTRVNPLSLY